MSKGFLKNVLLPAGLYATLIGGGGAVGNSLDTIINRDYIVEEVKKGSDESFKYTLGRYHHNKNALKQLDEMISDGRLSQDEIKILRDYSWQSITDGDPHAIKMKTLIGRLQQTPKIYKSNLEEKTPQEISIFEQDPFEVIRESHNYNNYIKKLESKQNMEKPFEKETNLETSSNYLTGNTIYGAYMGIVFSMISGMFIQGKKKLKTK